MIRRLATLSPFQAASSSSLTARTASSFPVPASHIPCRPILAGRGRVKSARPSVSARISAARQHREAHSTTGDDGVSAAKVVRGRSKRRVSAYSIDPLDNASAFEGTATQALHLGLTPSHLPLPIPLGVDHYFGQPGSIVNPVPTPSEWSTSLGPFDTNIAATSILHGDVQAMVKANGDAFDGHRSGLNDHLHVMYALARPGRSQHLREGQAFNGDFFDSDLPSLTSSLNSAVNTAGARNALAAETEWNDILAKLSGESSGKSLSKKEATQMLPEEKQAVDEAVYDLNSLLEGLEETAVGEKLDANPKMIAVVGPDGAEEWIRMDSTRRKRKKKMNKHKLKKRRKLQKALRKKLGK